MTEPFDINKTGRVIIETDEAPCCKPSDLELRIRREVMASLEDLLVRIENNNAVEHQACGLGRHIKDRLNLLWGE